MDISLFEAIENNDVNYLDHHSLDIHAYNEEGLSPMHFALRANNLDIVTLLVQKGANIHQKDAQGFSTAHWATSPEAVEELAYLGCNLNAVDNKGETALHWAVKTGQPELVSSLLYWGADCNIKNKAGDTPLHLAVKTEPRQPAIIKELFNYQADANILNNKNQSALHIAVGSADWYLARFLIIQGADVNQIDQYNVNIDEQNYLGQSLLHLAAMHNRPDLIEIGLQHGANINLRDAQGDSPLHLAVSNGHINLAKQLYNAGANIHQPSFDGLTPLDLALKSDAAMVAALGCDPKLIEAQSEFDKLDISQQVLNAKLTSYCQAKGFTILLEDKGNCGGWTFLYQYYLELNKEQEFKDIIAFIAKWDGDINSLQDRNNLPGTIKDKIYPSHLPPQSGSHETVKYVYKNGESLFENTINDLVEFQRTGEILNLHGAHRQSDRQSTYDFLNNSNKKLLPILFNPEPGMNIEKMSEWLTFLSKFQKHSWVDISVLKDSEAHNVSVKITNEGKYKYYDSNHIKFIPELTSSEEVAVFAFNALHFIPSSNSSPLINRFNIYQFGNLKANQEQLFSAIDESSALSDLDKLKLAYIAITTGNEAAFELLLSKGLNINHINNQGNSLLHLAVLHSQANIIELLIKNGADPKVLDGKGLTPFLRAVTIGDKNVLLGFVEARYDIQEKNHTGAGALHYAPNESTIQLLVKNGLDVNSKDSLGATPLHNAIDADNLEAVKALLSLGADTTIPHPEGMNIIALADSVNSELTLAILQHQQEVNKKQIQDVQPSMDAEPPLRKKSLFFSHTPLPQRAFASTSVNKDSNSPEKSNKNSKPSI